MVTVTIDGKTLEVAEGTTVLRAAESAGISIPTLCDHKSLAPYGGCRLCLVEVAGMRTLQPSCTLPVTPNMVVTTNSEKVKEARKFVLTLIFSERNHFCMYCQVSGGDCELQNAAYEEGMTHWPLQPNWQPFAVDASHPYFVLDNNRCILCRRCVRACAELVGNFTLGIEERGANSYLVADLGTPLGESTCISCGTCVQVCPTGSLIDRQSAYTGREKDATRTKSVCTKCSIGCGIELIHRDNRVSRIEGDWDAAVNGGLLCSIGRFEPLDEKRDRITTPLVRKGDGLKSATYQDALAAAAPALKADGIAALVSPSLPAETLNSFKKLFADGLKNVSFGTTDEGVYSAFNAKLSAVSKKPFESPLSSLDEADCIIVLGADLITDHQVAGFMVKRSQPAGVRLVVVDDADNKMRDLADQVIDTKGKLSDAINEIKSSEIVKNAGRITIVYGKGTLSADDAAAKALLSVAEELKKAGKVVDLVSLKGAGNSYAAYLYQLDKPVNLKKASSAFVFLGEEEPSQKLVKELEGVKFLVVQAAYASSLTARANVVLPAETWSEHEGHYINIDGLVQTSVGVVKAPEGIPGYDQVLTDLGKSCGVKVDGDWKKSIDKTLLVTEILGA